MPAGRWQLRKEPEPEPEPDPELDAALEELNRVCRWRVVGLLDLGFTLTQAMDMRLRPDVIHEAEALLARRLPHSLVHDELT